VLQKERIIDTHLHEIYTAISSLVVYV